jgi:protease-4
VGETPALRPAGSNRRKDQFMSDAPAPPVVPGPRRTWLGCAFTLSLLCNFLALALLLIGCVGVVFRWGWRETPSSELSEQHHSGDKAAADKIAVIRIEGIILEGLLSYVHKQIDQAAGDKAVKAVVLRINSPGGTVTASEDLHRRLSELAAGDPKKGTSGKPLVVSMGGLAASGGYYVAMPASVLYAEPTTLTGSIGVFVSLPNVTELADKIGFRMDTIKQGEIKDSGSPFHKMTDKERQVWQDMIDHSYQHFLTIVENGRTKVLGKGALLEKRTLTPLNAGPDWLMRDKGGPYSRYLADGGIWTADRAVEFKLIDHLGHLDDALTAAHDLAGLGEHYRVIQYEHPRGLVESLLGLRAPEAPATALDAARLQNALAPRLWYLAPGYEAAAFAAALRGTP